MSTYTQILYQIVFSTKYRDKVLIAEHRQELFRYIWGIIHAKQCVVYQINGVEDHIHIATHLHPSVALASLVKDVKVASSIWIKEQNLFPGFIGWQEGYGAFTYTYRHKDMIVNYIKKQETHHHASTFKDEYIRLLHEHGVSFDEKYLQ